MKITGLFHVNWIFEKIVMTSQKRQQIGKVMQKNVNLIRGIFNFLC